MTVLVVGAGPTGLALAAQLRAFRAGFRTIDRQPDQVHESRALAIQPRTLEVLTGLGIADTLVEHGNPAVRLQMHTGTRTAQLPLFVIGMDDTAYPFLLFLSQAETENILATHLARHGVTIERGIELTGLHQHPDHVTCTLRHAGGHTETLDAEYVVGCDGARSAVRHHADIDFTGGAYPQTFVLADLAADGLEPGAAHVYLSAAGMLFFFPLGRPAPWRLLAMRPRPDTPPPAGDEPAPSPAELRTLTDTYTNGDVWLHDPVWATYFRIHHRHATTYRADRVFLAGDAAHIHSPAGAQGMNTGIQDAWNLGWKLALTTGGAANPALLDTYQAERQPVGRNVLRFTDRAFGIATSTNPVIRVARTHIAPRLIRLAGRSRRARTAGLRTVAQLAINYRHSPAVEEGHPRLRRGPRAGERLPDAAIHVNGEPYTLHRALGAPRHHLLLTGSSDAWPTQTAALLGTPATGLVTVHRLTRESTQGALADTHGDAHARLGLDRDEGTAHCLVRPDGYIAYRAQGNDLTGLYAHLDCWLPGAPPR